MFNVHLLPASFGDSILLEYGNSVKKYILIDGGPYFNFEIQLKAMMKIAPDMKELELLVITHVDIDHIDGTILLLQQKNLPFTIKDVWFNGLQQMKQVDDDLLGVIQGEYVSVLLQKKQIPQNRHFQFGPVMVHDYANLPQIVLDGGMKLTLLGPNRDGLNAMKAKWDEEVSTIGDETAVTKRLEDDPRYHQDIDDLLGEPSIADWQQAIVKGDKSAANGSSIAFLAHYEQKTCLFTGDLFTEYLMQGIDALLQQSGQETLKVGAWKLAHHGSKKSTLEPLMKKISTRHVLVSSDGKRYHHPDKECMAKLIGHLGPDIHFHFNYKTSYNEIWARPDWQSQYHYKAFYPTNEHEPGLSISL